MNRFLTTFAIILILVFYRNGAGVEPPHNLTNGYTCSNCHSVHMTLGSTGLTNACLTCHRPGVPLAGRKPFTLADAATPFSGYTGQPGLRYQTSHNWSGPQIRPDAGAEEPASTELRSTKTLSGLGCPRCHDLHTYKDRPFLRAKIDRDQLCLDCHRSRGTTDHSLGTHPVNFNYTGAQSLVRQKPAEFNVPPLNANPSNPTSALPLKNGTLLCTTCHGVHYTDSNSSTFDNATSYYGLQPSAGALLRTDMRGSSAGSVNICTNCHLRQNHDGRGQNVQCADCHGGHVDEADGTRPNVFLVRRYMNISSPAGKVVNSKVMFQYTSAGTRPYKNAAGTGVCQACHTVPESAGYPGAHRLADAPANACSICHPHNEGGRGAFSAMGGSCSACHGSDEASGTPILTGRHGSHISPGANESLGAPFGCADCHARTVSNNYTILNPARHANGLVDYSGARAGGSAGYNGATRVCSNSYCHSDGKGSKKNLNAASWTSAATFDCRGCHGSDGSPAFTSRAGEPNYANSGAGSVRANSHESHTSGGAGSCGACHVQTTTSGTEIKAGSLKHVNSAVDVNFDPAKAGAATWTPGTKTCSNIGCHFGGSAQWGGILPVDCTGCHGGDTASAAPIASGKHRRHLDNYSTLGAGNRYTCTDCHASTVSGSRIISNRANHGNGIKNYSGARAGRINVSGSGSCTTAYCHSTGMQANQFWDMSSAGWYSSRTFTCNGCHGANSLPDGTFSAFTSVAGEPSYANGGAGTVTANSHRSHVWGGGIADSTGCARCHRQTVDLSQASRLRPYSTLHLNRNRDVAFSAVAGDGAVYTSSDQQCSTVYCHSNGLRFDNSTANFRTMTWGGAPLTCASCHGDSASAEELSGRHGKHTASTIYVSSCDRCHSGTIDGTGKIVDRSRHANRTKDISFNNGGSYNSGSKSCTTYCHSDARGGEPTFSVKWSDTDITMKCYSCHKGRTSDTSEGNCGVVQGNWSSAREFCTPDITMNADGHHRLVGPQWIRKYPCYYCHDATMDAAGDIKDRARHLNGVKDVKIAAKWEIPSRDKPSYTEKVCDNVYCHSDGTIDPDVVRPFPWNAPKTECNSCHGHPTGSCNNAGCHDNKVHPGDPTGRVWNLPAKFGNQTAYRWPAGQEWIGSLPMFPNQGPGTARANSHPRHAQTNFTCDICHAKTIKGDCISCHKDGIPPGGMGEVAHIDAAYHVNKKKDVDFKDMPGADYDPITRSCSGTTCHTSGVDPVWGGSVGSAVTCLSCHGITGPDVDDFDAFNGTQGKINLTQWETSGHGRYSSAAYTGSYPFSRNPAASFPGNPCWYCHDNSVLHSDPSNPYRLRMHGQFDRRFEKECVYCHMERTDLECISCHVGQTQSLSPQATAAGILFRYRNTSTEIRHPSHTALDNCTALTCHDSDTGLFPGGTHKGHNTNSGIWTREQIADVKNQYMMMGVCLQCHDDDSNGQCTSCHIAPSDNPMKYSLGYDPGTGFIKPRKARASGGHFGYKHYRAFKESGGWAKDGTGNYLGTWKGGKFCWDCHDPHGDANLYMIQKKVATTTDGKFGRPKTQAVVTFTEDTGAYYAKKTEPFDGICNVCHSASSKHFTRNSGDGHNINRRCTICHEHRFTDSHASKQNCDSCHTSTKPIPKHTAFGLPRDCVKCHSGTVGKRMDIIGQMKSNSHHVQGVELNNRHCYQCHWEATPEGLIDNQYHTGYNYKTYTSVRNDTVDLVIYGPNLRPPVYREISSVEGRATAVKFVAVKMGTGEERNQVDKVTVHCISCHSDQNNYSTPFNDCKTPRQYAWDLQSIAARYSQTGTTNWGKYSATATAAKKIAPKSFSAHGNAVGNSGGWDPATGVDEGIPNSRNGSTNVGCFDCHNSHGSKVQGVTTSYVTFNGTNNGGNLKETKKDIGGYTADYKASSNSLGVNPYGAGAGQCFDCHNTANAGTAVPTGKTPWGYSSTFGASAPIMGYKDTARFGEGVKASTARFPERDSRKTILGGHLKASEPGGALPNLAKDTGTATGGTATTLTDSGKNWPLNKWRNSYLLMATGSNSGQLRKIISSTETVLTVDAFAATILAGDMYRIVPYSATVNGLCTPCHDPHGVTPTLGSNQEYGVPLLKGTWMTSPYKEDAPPPDPSGSEATDKSWGKFTGAHKYGFYGTSPVTRHTLDRNTFGTSNGIPGGAAKRPSESDSQFAGLCLNCHTKENLTDGTNRNDGAAGFKTIDRIHESVKGWGANTEHSFTCSKCHQPHNSGLPRLMQTNCLDYKHRGGRVSGGQAWGVDKQYNSSRPHGTGNEHRGYPIGSMLGGAGSPDATTACHVGRYNPAYNYSAPPAQWPNGNYWNDKTPW
ncbi:Geobacter sulfurreducens CxxxxCH...CXXCH domain-containing protein [Geobacter sp. DSM 9736]|nr:CxxxxCH/CxxCH domain-containing protein [Geobacter sp. DSM 9736]SNB45863.1 Geobacter sulfurreducens CxxxxCH...CXXCH domain-containing protein [Geobacter sp. DSM 9736]